MPIGDRIKELRTKLRLSQGELGDKIDTDSSIVSRWETNRVRPSHRYIAKLAKALGTSADYLLGDTDDPSPSDNMLLLTPSVEDADVPKRLIIKNRDMYVDLPETAEGFEILRKFFDMQAMKNGMSPTAVVAM